MIDLEALGFKWRFSVEKRRQQEYIDLYEGMGLEVYLRGIDIHGDNCTVCFEAEPEMVVEIWTRKAGTGPPVPEEKIDTGQSPDHNGEGHEPHEHGPNDLPMLGHKH